MRPILLSGHERSLTQVKYNAEGDLLFSASKDHIINVWHSHNGERLGTYEGHNGTVWTIDADSTSTYLISGSADNNLKLWDVRTGTCLYTWEFPTAVKRVMWSEDDSKILAVTEQRMGFKGAVRVFEINRDDPTKQSVEPLFQIESTGSKATVAAWCALDQYIVTGHENGYLNLWDMDGELFYEKEDRAHSDLITDLQMAPDGTYFITSSKDKSAKIWSIGPDKNSHGDEDYLTLIKTFTGEPPLNSAAILPGKPYALLGGGQEAMAVTTTGARHGHFEVRFWHLVFEEEVARVKGGFGPCNTIAVHPQTKGYAIGGEDGYVRVHHFDDDFFAAKPYGASLEPED
ncbi:BQ5605_C005g03580 [Microbotryum silenes-dioicae]|uniref:Eukaryotic translation initiation factor 3 subunit I n=1 Tax=Microbotryum silenes-dioicae TaxID=796604 RepID=A0A2X0MFQ8_9BASI|nr:BQ5605_C005g03580 [Microbotryum silenes-dioicae]